MRHRLDFRGNRRINGVLYITSVTQQRDIVDARVDIDQKLTDGKTRREARRAHKRHLANRVIRRMWIDERHRLDTLLIDRLTRERLTAPLEAGSVRVPAWMPRPDKRHERVVHSVTDDSCGCNDL